MSQLIVALDVDTFDEAKILVDSLGEIVDIFKVGSQLFTACGPAVNQYLLEKRKKVFLDLKFHDIPNTVANAVSSAVGLSKMADQGLFMLSVHTAGGGEMLKKAAQAAAKKAASIQVKKPLIVGITVLTSDEKKDNIHELVLERASLAKEAGCDGVVASGQEASIIRKKLGNNFVIVTPGIRLSDEDSADQKRIATPAEAIQNGSDYLVVGRSVIKAINPLGVVKKILEQMDSVK